MKLWVHKQGDKYGEAQVVLSAKAFPHLKLGDLVEIYHDTEDSSRLLLQYTHKFDVFSHKDTVSIEQSLASQFHLKAYCDIVVNLVDKQYAALDLVELTFKEQYLSRSDMWRFRKELINTCTHVNKTLGIMRIRCYVNELWSQGERWTCGYINEDTRIVFRTTSSMMYIFIQMSSEMSEFDTQGDIYFEKCANGFLPEVFRGWAHAKCSHYVNFVIFSRWYYKGISGDDSPPQKIAHVLQKDFRGRYYQDFYRLLVQNEHYEDWLPVLRKLKLAFHNYKSGILQFHRDVLGIDVENVELDNSSSAEGNFLEALNMSLNVYAKHNIDRKLERTGQQIVLISPGGGVFNVDRGLASLTKQRVIDLGVSIDIVCLGEQPLHAVPLFIYHNRSRIVHPDKDPEIEDYFIPHWMNYNFYNPQMYRRTCCTFRPRIKIPEFLLENRKEGIYMDIGESDPFTYPDFDAFDMETFAPFLSGFQTGGGKKKCSVDESNDITFPNGKPRLKRQSSDPSKLFDPDSQDVSQSVGSGAFCETDSVETDQSLVFGTSAEATWNTTEPSPINRPRGGSITTAAADAPEMRVGSLDTPSYFTSLFSGQQRQYCSKLGSESSEKQPKRRPLINPFIPSEISVRITSNRRRWIHVFPTNRAGQAKQAHVMVSGSSVTYANVEEQELRASESGRPPSVNSSRAPSLSTPSHVPSGRKSPPLRQHGVENVPLGPGAGPVTGTGAQGRTLVWGWGPTGEEQWNPDVEIGVDWKSMVQPALLPTTTDFFPDARSLKNDYFVYQHTVLLDDQCSKEDWPIDAWGKEYRLDIFEELICQRLQRGFQIIILPKNMLHSAVSNICSPIMNSEKECYLSINRIYHRLNLLGGSIYVTQFIPRHSYHLKNTNYQYQFQVPDNESYEFSKTRFEHEAWEKSNWSVLDNYIVTQGQYDAYQLQPGMKFWDSRFAVLPNVHSATKTIISEISNPDFLCDIYFDTWTKELEPLKLTENMLKFIEVLNRIRRVSTELRFIDIKENVKTEAEIPTAVSAIAAAEESGTPELSTSFPSLILSSMVDTEKGGLNFLQNEKLPSKCFVSAELVHWLILKVSDLSTIFDAIGFCQDLLDGGKIRHVSGESRKFKYGFFLYVVTKDDGKVVEEENKSVQSAQWIEVELLCKKKIADSFKCQEYELDPGRKLSRKEWSQIQYSACYTPCSAFHLELQWLVGAGSTVCDLVFNVWSRRASQCLFHLIPVPLDPFAFPYNPASDPLRCPVHIPLPRDVIGVLPKTPFYNLRVRILQRFGFIRLQSGESEEDQYIHLSGSMFVLLPSDGFLWSWNLMLSHRYRTLCTGDEAFQDKMLADFRRFCNNEGGRLRRILNEIMTEIEENSQ